MTKDKEKCSWNNGKKSGDTYVKQRHHLGSKANAQEREKEGGAKAKKKGRQVCLREAP